MFADLFIDPGTIARYRSTPLFEERLSYLEYCASEGARRRTLREVAAHQTRLVHLLDLREPVRVSMDRIEAVAMHWSRPDGRGSHRPARPSERQRFVGHALRWLRFVDLLDEPCTARHPHAGEVEVFAAWMREERGWSEETIRCCLKTVERFFDGLNVPLASVRIADIDQVVTRWQAGGCSRTTVHCYAQRLRTFFRFAERQGWCVAALADGIMPMRFHPGEAVPAGLSRDDVSRLLATSDTDQPVDVRDRAILSVLIAYGLRRGEVAGLRLDDLDWKEETLQVRCPKPGRTHRYPLSRGVGEAIVRYLTDVRPPRSDRTLFLTARAPIRPLSPDAISRLVRRRLNRLGITGKRRGPHALRHSAAQHLLDHGFSMKDVGDYLGHRRISSTSVYAKVRLGILREVAEIDLEDLA
ncbi:MAG: tyrosine-type recombinase/integrase [Gammaproteobacteria bacterium]|nr:tyrosine-type recombinase/integrase [Gammaproteobacteria bacterium]MDE0248227.1 tyrosine-type recombinase/integrase [Gammaproteobacteria bacterium]